MNPNHNTAGAIFEPEEKVAVGPDLDDQEAASVGGLPNVSIPRKTEARSVLMIAFHYPPCRGSSGLQRSLSFSRYLPSHGWSPIVLSASPRSYADRGEDQLKDIPNSVSVKRAFALDTARHLSLRGRYVSWMSLPDRWVSWYLGAVPTGLRLIRRYRPKVIWSTYPIATSHLIGLTLHRLTGLPWVADFRDPMTELDPITGQNHPPNPRLWRVRRWIESHTVRACTRAVLVTQGSLRIHAERYADQPASHWAVIGNGFDEQAFAGAERIRPSSAPNRPLVLLHSGVLYPTPDRDPTALFAALAKLRSAGRLSAADLKIVLRASGHDDRYRKQIRDLGIEDLVSLEPPVAYREALAEMLSADGLLLFQGYTSNPAIPAKLYEYLRARRPIFAMVDSEGDTAATLKKAGVGRIVPLESSEKIAAELIPFLEGLRRGAEPVATESEIFLHSREAKSAELASVLDSAVTVSPGGGKVKDRRFAMLTPHPTLRRSDLFSGCRNDLRALCDGDSLYLTYNARGALYQLLQAIPQNKGNVVLLPAFHCTALVEPVAHSHLRAVFYRIKPDLSIDFDDLRSKATSDVALIVAIHFFGFPIDLSPLLELRKQLGCYLLEDCAHSFLTLDGGRSMGHRGDFSIYSYYKTVPSLFGAALRINHKPFQFTPPSNSISWKESAVICKRLFEQIIDNSNDGFWRRTYQFLENRRVSSKKAASATSQPTASSFADDPYLFRSDLAEARIPWSCKSILRSSDWQAFVAARRRNYALLNVALKENNVLSKVLTCLPEGVCPWAYPVLFQNRVRFEQELRARGVPLFTFGEALHPLLAQSDSSTRKDAEDLSNRLMMLPVHQNLSKDDVAQFAEEINRFLADTERTSVESLSTTVTPQPVTSRGCL